MGKEKSLNRLLGWRSLNKVAELIGQDCDVGEVIRLGVNGDIALCWDLDHCPAQLVGDKGSESMSSWVSFDDDSVQLLKGAYELDLSGAGSAFGRSIIESIWREVAMKAEGYVDVPGRGWFSNLDVLDEQGNRWKVLERRMGTGNRATLISSDGELEDIPMPAGYYHRSSLPEIAELCVKSEDVARIVKSVKEGWLQEQDQLVRESACPTAPPRTLGKQDQQDTLILQTLEEMGHTLPIIPPNIAGKKGVKNQVWNELRRSADIFKNKQVFDKSWHRLRASKKIANKG